MEKSNSSKKIASIVRKFYPQLNENQIQEAEENLMDFLEVVLEIYEDIRSDPQAYAQLKTLTASNREVTIRDK
ncbi:hypothetical protein MYX78_12510 [Acidobacteria bacterium AH-259-G07]|nr:hypothetical protein [Acidobacteria bacterium AH-259-G07]